MKPLSLQTQIHKVLYVTLFLIGIVGCEIPITTPTDLPEPTLTTEEQPEMIENFEACVAAGMPVMESFPKQCRTDDGQLFVEDIGNAMEKINLIRLDIPRPNQVITSPLKIEGEARGTWFFEGDFPVKLLDENGEVIAQHYVTARGEWMTEDFVQFSGELLFTAPETEFGRLVLEKDNPSGLPEHADALNVPVRFRQSQ